MNYEIIIKTIAYIYFTTNLTIQYTKKNIYGIIYYGFLLITTIILFSGKYA